MKNVLIFILGFVVGLLGFLILDDMKEDNNPITDDPSLSVSDGQNNEKNYEIKVIKGELTGFADTRTIEIVTVDGPVFCSVYDENMIAQLEELIDTNIKVEVKYNLDTKVGIVSKIL